MRKALRSTVLPIATALVASMAGAAPARATAPGSNGLIAFGSTRDGNAEIYVMQSDGSGQTNISNNNAWDYYPAWSPDGARIAFVSTRSAGDAEVYVMNADGSNPTRVTQSPGTGWWDAMPTWSPDGTKIAFQREYIYSAGTGDIYVVNADGTGLTDLTPSTPGSDRSPDWSPDGSLIAFSSDRAGEEDVYVMNADGTGVTDVSDSSQSEGQPSWSPDGTKLAFTSSPPNDYDISVMNADGTGRTDLTNTAGTFEAYPEWSPDGTQIAFWSAPPGVSNGDVYTMNADGTGRAQLTDSPGDDDVPSWQPVARLAFTGFFAPVDNQPVFNALKAGAAVPVRFSLGGNQGTDVFAAGYPKSATITCASDANVDGIEQTVTSGSSSLAYDPVTDVYTYVWKTQKTWASTCRQLVLKLSDGTSHRANFAFK